MIAGEGEESALKKDDSKYASSNTADYLYGSKVKSTFVDLSFKGTVARDGIFYQYNLFRIKRFEHFRFRSKLSEDSSISCLLCCLD